MARGRKEKYLRLNEGKQAQDEASKALKLLDLERQVRIKSSGRESEQRRRYTLAARWVRDNQETAVTLAEGFNALVCALTVPEGIMAAENALFGEGHTLPGRGA